MSVETAVLLIEGVFCTVLTVKGWVCPVLELRGEIRTSAIVGGCKMDFFLYFIANLLGLLVQNDDMLML